jgi:hypothetical protein
MTKSSNNTKTSSVRFLSIAATALALELTGCVTTDPSPAARVAAAPAAGPIPPGQAAITITRGDGYYAKATAADVDVNGSRFTSIDMGATFTG